MRKYSLTVVCSIGLLATVAAQDPYTAYDTFSAASIAPRLWRGQETSGEVREALRLVVADPLVAGNRRLLLLNVAYGGFESNTGTSAGTLAVNVTDPGAVGAIRATVEAGNFWSGACAANTTDPTTTMAGIGGAFFNPNATAGSAAGDVWATLGLERRSNSTDAANVLAVVARLTQCKDAKCEQRITLGEQSLGTAARGQRVVLALEWDRANKQFLFQRGATAVAIPYSVADTVAPGVHGKGLLTTNAVANCAASPAPTAAFMEAYFDDVSTKPAPALPPVFPPDQYEPNDSGLQAVNLGQIGEDRTVFFEASIHSMEDTDWFRIRAVETTSPFCWPGSDQPYLTTFQLTGIPPGSDYDLLIRADSPGGFQFSAIASGNADESVPVNWFGTCGAADDRDFYVEIRRGSGPPSDAKYRLTVSHRRN